MGVFKNRLKRIEDRILEKKEIKITVTHGDNTPPDFDGFVVSGDPRGVIHGAREIIKSVTNKESTVVKNDSTDEPVKAPTQPKKEKVVTYRGIPVNPEIEPAEKPEAKKKPEPVPEDFGESIAGSQHGHWNWD